MKSEFEKRIHEKAMVKVGHPYEVGWYEETGFKDESLVVDEESVVYLKDVKKIIDEAATEFRALFYTGKEYSFEKKTKTDLFNYLHRKTQERDNWFAKWFGDAES